MAMAVKIRQLLAQRQRALPYSLRVVLENLARNSGEGAEERQLIANVAGWMPGADALIVPLKVDRVVLPDSSGLPVLLDFAALRDALVREGMDPSLAEPAIPCQLVVDHSLIVDQAGHAGAALFNLGMEYKRNSERYSVFKWAQQAFNQVRVIPPGMGIIHQVHLEYLAQVMVEDRNGAHPEFVLGCDSHTPMVNALGVLGWGVGGIDAEAALVGERYSVRIPRVVGVRLIGALRAGVTTTDLVLTLTQRLRQLNVVGDFVEFTGDGLDGLAVPERATIANMAPEYGATCSYFPIDKQTLRYLGETGRTEAHIEMVREAAEALGLFRISGVEEPVFSDLLELDLDTVEPSLAGPRRPQDRVALDAIKPAFARAIAAPRDSGGFGAQPHAEHGKLAIAAITACTNTSNPALMLGAGLLARNAAARGLRPPTHVKTSLAPGSRVVVEYLRAAGLLSELEKLGFFTVGFGCTTCSGKSGPIEAELESRSKQEGIVLAAILSGNRNFDGRIHKSVQAAYLGSPMLVVAFALAGRVDIDFKNEPLGTDEAGKPVFLADLWPSNDDIAAMTEAASNPALYQRNYASVFAGTPEWQRLAVPTGPRFSWDEASTYIKRPPFFDADFLASRRQLGDSLMGARVLMRFGDSLTTDHVTPSGEIPEDTLAGQYLISEGVAPAAFNAYTQRRGNHEVLARATFANPRIRNLMLTGREGGYTRHFPEDTEMSVYEAARSYAGAGTPTLVLAGKDYGMGSSRDWAAKGPALLGLSMVVAKSFERIHRSNLIGVGILPALFNPDEDAETLGLDGSESYDITGIGQAIAEGTPISVSAMRVDGSMVMFSVTAALYGRDERELIQAGGIFPRIFNRLLKGQPSHEL